jgi:hypothetical protein
VQQYPQDVFFENPLFFLVNDGDEEMNNSPGPFFSFFLNPGKGKKLRQTKNTFNP